MFFLGGGGYCSKTRADKLQKTQNGAERIITRADYSIRSSDVLNSLQWSNLEERRKRHLLVTMYSIINVRRTFGSGFIEPLDL